MPTQDEIKASQLRTEVKRLEDQEKVLKGITDEMQKQISVYYAKRREASSSLDALVLEEKRIREQLAKDRQEIEHEKRKLGEERILLNGMAAKLDDAKAQFAKERAVYRQNVEDLEKVKKSVIEQCRGIEKKEAELAKKGETLEIGLSGLNERMKEIGDKMVAVLKRESELSTKEFDLGKRVEECKNITNKYDEMMAVGRKQIQVEREDMLEEIKAKSKEMSTLEEFLKKRELTIVTKEDEIEIKLGHIKAKMEQLAIEKGRKRT